MLDHATILRLLEKQKRQARDRSKYAVETGKILRSDKCQKCGSSRYVEMHHKDYSKPLEVTWLCRSCHRKKHVASGGVSWSKSRQRWRAEVFLRRESGVNKCKYLGVFETKEEALERVRNYKIRNGR